MYAIGLEVRVDRSADEDHVSLDRHRVAEVLPFEAVAGDQPRLLGPARSIPSVDVGGSRLVAGVAVGESADHHAISVARDGESRCRSCRTLPASWENWW